MSLTPSRRSFITAFSSFAGIAAIPSDAAAGVQAMPQDLAWFDEFRGRHKQVYDYGWNNLKDPLPALRFPRNFLNSVRDTFRLEFPEVNTAVGVTNTAFPLNASDALWEKYTLGEQFGIIDPVAKKPALRNIFLDGGEFSVKALQARGTVFWQCRFALAVVAQQLATASGRALPEVQADLLAGLNPGVRVVPSHMLALDLAHTRGFSYTRT